jgi:hypothetical protein
MLLGHGKASYKVSCYPLALICFTMILIASTGEGTPTLESTNNQLTMKSYHRQKRFVSPILWDLIMLYLAPRQRNLTLADQGLPLEDHHRRKRFVAPFMLELLRSNLLKKDSRMSSTLTKFYDITGEPAPSAPLVISSTGQSLTNTSASQTGPR